MIYVVLLRAGAAKIAETHCRAVRQLQRAHLDNLLFERGNFRCVRCLPLLVDEEGGGNDDDDRDHEDERDGEECGHDDADE